MIWFHLQIAFARAHEGVTRTDVLRAMIKADWTAQEHRKNRTPDEPAAIHEAYQRAKALLNDLNRMPQAPKLSSEAAVLKHLQNQVDSIYLLDLKTRLSLYQKIRSLTRNLVLKNPLIISKSIVFMKRPRTGPPS